MASFSRRDRHDRKDRHDDDEKRNLAPVITGPNNGDDYGARGEPPWIKVNENQLAVTTVTATDRNGDPLSFSIVKTAGTDFDKFAIDAKTGVLTFIKAPDFEAPTDVGGKNGDNEYWVNVQVKDPGGLTDTQRIIVRVADVNETPLPASPVITGPNNGNNYGDPGQPPCIQVNENLTGVTTVTATDANLDQLAFSIVNTAGTDFSKFTIDATTGVLTFINAPDFEAPTDVGGVAGDNEYWVDVMVKDPGGLTDTQRIIVCVEDVNENLPPAITGPNNGNDYPVPGGPQSIQVNENQTAVTTVIATDPNGDPLIFSIVNTAGTDFAQFTIDATTGVLTFINAPNFEAPTDIGGFPLDNEYWINVQVKDPGGLTDTQQIVVRVADVIEADPNDFDDFILPAGPGVIIGTDGSDIPLNGTSAGETIIGKSGFDDIRGNGGADTIYGQAGNDTIGNTGVFESAVVYGGSGNDLIFGGGGDDHIFGGSGNDTIIPQEGTDVVVGGFGADNIIQPFVDGLPVAIRFDRVEDFGDTIEFKPNDSDRIQFAQELNAAYDDITNDDVFQFATGNGIDNDNQAVDLDTAVEALLLGGANGEGLGSAADLADAALVAAEFNNEFAITASVGQDALLVINQTIGGRATMWHYVEAGGAGIQGTELQLIGTLTLSGGVFATTSDFQLV